ncbi:hypothetical protein [Mycoplasmopsis felifaucium]|uniref:hypothetical protein n=1 Tax=Mycoplasmopsis felifaucium TaxID=35768 RepID=UPI0012EB289B|nr:hypothetical protein [Mycoplasmopsis felifaucium]
MYDKSKIINFNNQIIKIDKFNQNKLESVKCVECLFDSSKNTINDVNQAIRNINVKMEIDEKLFTTPLRMLFFVSICCEQKFNINKLMT